MKPYLTDDEIAEITQPLTQGAARIRYFEKLGCKVRAKPNGQPLVGRAEYEAVSSPHVKSPITANAANVVDIDWSRVRSIGRRPRAA